MNLGSYDMKKQPLIQNILVVLSFFSFCIANFAIIFGYNDDLLFYIENKFLIHSCYGSEVGLDRLAEELAYISVCGLYNIYLIFRWKFKSINSIEFFLFLCVVFMVPFVRFWWFCEAP